MWKKWAEKIIAPIVAVVTAAATIESFFIAESKSKRSAALSNKKIMQYGFLLWTKWSRDALTVLAFNRNCPRNSLPVLTWCQSTIDVTVEAAATNIHHFVNWIDSVLCAVYVRSGNATQSKAASHEQAASTSSEYELSNKVFRS